MAAVVLLFLVIILFTMSAAADVLPRVWPHLVGKDAEEAKATVQQNNPSITAVHVLPTGSMVTQDYRHDRVRIFVNEKNEVVRPPAVG